MNPSLAAPGHTETVRAASALVLAPHYDDEVLGCGGLVLDLIAVGAEVRVLFLTDSGGGVEEVDDAEAYRRRRRAEAEEAAKVLGLAGTLHLDLPDGALDQHPEALDDGIRRALDEHVPELLLVTSPLEASPDHRAAFQAVHRLLGAVREADTVPLGGSRGDNTAAWSDVQVLLYEVNHSLYPDLLVDTSAHVERLAEAMTCYASQQERHDYLAAHRGRMSFRTHTLPPGVAAAEAYRRLKLEDFTTRGPARLVSELGGAPERLEITEGPRLSVIVRTRDRPRLLAEALASLAASTYRRAEVVVVNDGGTPPELPSDFPLPIRRLDLDPNRGRSGAANAGIAAADGDYITFLDDDDLVEPEHLATLTGLVTAVGVRVAYTDAAVGVYELADTGGAASGWHCTERRLPYSRDFDPDLLLFDNYIPFNTLLIERGLFDEVGEIDSELPFFEDWDVLIRLAAVTPFHHLGRVTCEYRQFRGAGHHILGDEPRRRGDFLAMKARVMAKHAERRTPEVTSRVVDLLRAEAVAEAEEKRRLRRALRREEERFHECNGKLTATEIHLRAVEDARGRAQAELEQERGQRRELDREVDRLNRREQDLGAELKSRQSHVRDLDAEIERLNGRERELLDEIDKQVGAWRERFEAAESRAAEDLAAAHAAHGDTSEKLRLMTEQEGRVADELRATYAEIERLNGLIREMESTRAWRLHQWVQNHKPGRGGAT